MSIRISTMEIQGNLTLEENSLPRFRAKKQDRILDGSGLLEKEKEKYGYQTGERVLPYLVQDVYSRERKNERVKTIELENQHLKAVFLPEYGMRLFSLYSKDENRELLFRNSVLQFANLAIRDAWFAGGIEWNIGQIGHTFTTCDHVFAAICKNKDGEEFLRCYEYERCKGIYWQVDFYLEEDEKQLAVYVRFINPKNEAVPFYWWTNIAVPEEKNVRIFSGSQEVIYINPSSNEAVDAIKGMSHGTMPELESLPGKDASYPQNFRFSSEYFFQNEADTEQTWEAAVYNDGKIFFDCSSERLQYRKMFCWGTHLGGQHWKDFLSNKGKGDYVEIQAGLAPTQVHGLDIPAKTSWDFVQVFGSTKMDPELVKGEWNHAKSYVDQQVKKQVDAKKIQRLLEKYRENADCDVREFLHLGSGFGAVEELRKPGAAPAGFYFPGASIGKKEAMWVELLRKHEIEDQDIFDSPLSYMVDTRYETYLKEAAEKGGYTAKNLYGIMCFEDTRFEEGILWFQKSVEAQENPLAYRNLFYAYKDLDADKAIIYLEKALAMFKGNPKREYVEEYTGYLSEKKMYQKLWDYYWNLPEGLQTNERVILNVIPAAVGVKDCGFLEKQFQKEFVHIREGERAFTECYFAYQALKEARETGEEYTEELVQKYVRLNQVPENIDFRQSEI